MSVSQDEMSSIKDSLKLCQEKVNEDTKEFNLAYLQLLLVLPPQSKGLLPEHLQKVMTDINYGCLHYYPKDFKVMTFLKNKMWECNPLIPNINVEDVKSYLKELDN
jgi:5'-3' exonuclease